MSAFPRKPRKYPSKPALVQFTLTCPSTFGNGTYTCQIVDPRHLENHHGPAGIWWTDLQADEAAKAA